MKEETIRPMNGISQGQTAPEYGGRKIRARILMSILGVSISGVAVGFFSYSELGLDPFQCFAHGIWNRTPLSFGTWYMLLNAALLALVFFINRSKIGIGTLINLFLLGYIAEASEKLLLYLFPDKTTPLRAVSRDHYGRALRKDSVPGVPDHAGFVLCADRMVAGRGGRHRHNRNGLFHGAAD